MPRGFSWQTYYSDDGTPFQTRVDADEAAQPDRGWAASIPGGDQLPRGFRTRRVYGISASSGVSRWTRIGSTAAALWTGAALTFTVEASDGTIDTLTVVRSRGEYRPTAS